MALEISHFPIPAPKLGTYWKEGRMAVAAKWAQYIKKNLKEGEKVFSSENYEFLELDD